MKNNYILPLSSYNQLHVSSSTVIPESSLESLVPSNSGSIDWYIHLQAINGKVVPREKWYGTPTKAMQSPN